MTDERYAKILKRNFVLKHFAPTFLKRGQTLPLFVYFRSFLTLHGQI